MIGIEPRPGSREAQVTFTVAPNGLGGPVVVAGDFNGWDTSAHPMTSWDGTFQATVLIGTGRRYAFKYLAADRHWFNDDAADDYVTNTVGGVDSVLDLTYLRWARPDPARAHTTHRTQGG